MTGDAGVLGDGGGVADTERGRSAACAPLVVCPDPKRQASLFAGDAHEGATKALPFFDGPEYPAADGACPADDVGEVRSPHSIDASTSALR